MASHERAKQTAKQTSPSPTTCLAQPFRPESPTVTLRCPPSSTSEPGARRVTQEASSPRPLPAPSPAPPPTPGLRQMGPPPPLPAGCGSDQRPSEVCACGSGASCLPVVAPRLTLQRGEERRQGLEAPRAGEAGGRARGRFSRGEGSGAAQWLADRRLPPPGEPKRPRLPQQAAGQGPGAL